MNEIFFEIKLLHDTFVQKRRYNRILFFCYITNFIIIRMTTKGYLIQFHENQERRTFYQFYSIFQ